MVVPKANQTNEQVLKLMHEKDKVEAKIAEYGFILGANDNVGLQGSLVDGEGFPRNDIDVYQVRQARQQIICLQNDHKELMKQIEALLHKLHAESGAQHNELAGKAAGMQIGGAGGMESTTSEATDAGGSPLKAIATVNLVSPGSPAEDAGLCYDDNILEFGSINSRNFSYNLNEIGAIVQHKQNQRISLKVQRNGQILDLILIPKLWTGRGLLGCNIVLTDKK